MTKGFKPILVGIITVICFVLVILDWMFGVSEMWETSHYYTEILDYEFINHKNT